MPKLIEEFDPDDLTEISCFKDDEEEISGTVNKIGIICFKYKGVEYEAEYTKTVSWDERSGQDTDIDITMPNNFPDNNEDWSEVCEILEDEIR